MMAIRRSAHEEVWLQLPWLANGRLSAAERAAAEAHLAGCEECREELTRQRLMCEALTTPERVTYAPGPSFRKLMERIDADEAAPRLSAAPKAPAPARLNARGGVAAAWRPPGLAWAATFLLALGLASFWLVSPRYGTLSDPPVQTPGVLHVAFDRSLPLGELEQLLEASGARVVEGPDRSGIFGIVPRGASASAAANPQLRALAARLSANPHVRWIEPLSDTANPGSAQGRRSGEP